MIEEIRAHGENTLKLVAQGKARITFPEWALITISENEKGKLITGCDTCMMLAKSNCYEKLSLVFHDVTEETVKECTGTKQEGLYTCFTEDMAKKVIAFIDRVNKKNIPALIAQCAAGISRSGAIAVFACRYLGLNENTIREHHKYIGPNPHVYDTLVKVSGMRGEYEAWWENLPMDPSIEKMFQ